MERLATPFVIFKGGGYDGCWWEYNIVVLGAPDVEQRFGLSGYRGRDFAQILREVGLRGVYRDKAIRAYYEPDAVFTKAQWLRVQRDYGEGFTRGIAAYLNLTMLCQGCGVEHGADEIYHTRWRGAGGTRIAYTDNLCESCADDQDEARAVDHCRSEWPRLGLRERLDWVRQHNDDGGETISIFAIRRDTLPPLRVRLFHEGERW